MLAIIGGSGFERFEGFERGAPLDRATPFGEASSGIAHVRVHGRDCLFLSRHGEHHELLPSEINYRANIFALKRAGASGIISFSAIGSLVKECAPGDLVVVSQYIDRTKARAASFCGKGLVGHVSLAQPTSARMAQAVRQLLPRLDFKAHFNKTYLCIEGPYFSTQAESLSYRQMGAHVIGMTNFPEYALAREAGLPYLSCSFVTDYDCWDDSIPHVTVAEVLKVMQGNKQKAFSTLALLLEQGDFWRDCPTKDQGLKAGLFCDVNRLSPEQRGWLAVLTGD
jgi:5'-methylthioadenosine phosphorylase